jgi:hypothetical protein
MRLPDYLVFPADQVVLDMETLLPTSVDVLANMKLAAHAKAWLLPQRAYRRLE